MKYKKITKFHSLLLILFLACFDLRGEETNLCLDPHQDEYYLLKESNGFSIEVRPDGKSFTAWWNDKPLRLEYADEKFYKDQSGGNLLIDYEIIKQDCGGVDIVYTVNNPTGIDQNLPDFQIDGFQRSPDGDLYYLNAKDAGNLEKIDRSNMPNPLISWNYPGIYSPAIVTKDDWASIGTSFIYPLLEYKHRLILRLDYINSGLRANTWQHRYRGAYLDGGPTVRELMGPNEIRTYTITVRFAHPRYWLLTLSPYKEFFKSTYGSYSGPPADRRPVFTRNVASRDDELIPENPRRYNLINNIHDPNIGWCQLVDDLIGTGGGAGLLNTLGYERFHLWLPSGKYERHQSDMNFPPAFMDFLPYLVTSADQEFPRIAADGKELGFWWGRSDQVPVDGNGNVVTEWGTQQSVIPADYANQAHKDFMTSQLQLALQRGAKTIGLDNFVKMLPWERYQWTLDMKAMAPDVLFVHEGSGSDLFHAQIANWSYPYQWDRPTHPAPDVLSRYLNGHAELWVQQDHDEQTPFEVVQQLVKWGFTPLLNRGLDVHGLDYALVQCFDGIDNDNDGLTDFPYDPDCIDAGSNNESGGNNQPPSVYAGEDQVITLPNNQVSLDGVVSDDGFPLDPGQFTTLWSKLSGSGDVDFADAGKSHTTATFSLPDVYILRLSANDGALNSFDDVKITVRDPSADTGISGETRFIACMDPSNAVHRGNPPLCYHLKEAGRVRLTIFTKNGQEVRTLVDRQETAGAYSINWDRRNNAGDVVSSGIYTVILEAGDKKMKYKVAVIK